MTLAGVNVPAGSLLVTNGGASFDKIYAVNATTGAILATLDLGQNLDPVAGLYDAASGSLYILGGSAAQVFKLNPATGAVQSSFATPIPILTMAGWPSIRRLATSGSAPPRPTPWPKSPPPACLVRTIDLASLGISQRNQRPGLQRRRQAPGQLHPRIRPSA